MTDTTYIFGIYFPTLVLLIILFFYALELRRKARELKKREEDLMKRPAHILKDAHERALHIVKEATADATRIVTSSKKTHEDVETRFQEALDQALSQYLSVFKVDTITAEKAVITDIKKTGEESKQTLEKVVKDLQDTAAKDLEDMEYEIENEHESLRTYMKQKIDAEYEKMKKEMDTFKEGQYEEMKDKIEKKVNEIAVAVLGKSLSTSDHMTLILGALEKAKKEQFL